MGAKKGAIRSKSQPTADASSANLALDYDTNPFWQSSLFSDVYLRNDVPQKYKEIWDLEEAGSFFEFCEQFRNLCEELRLESFDSWSERTTINRFIKPVLKLLGWANNCSPNQEPWAEDESLSIRESGDIKTYKPDFIIVNDPKQLKYIEGKTGDAKLEEARGSSIISIEAKYWGRIDESRYSAREDKKRADKKTDSDAARSLDFDEQCLKYVDVLHHDYGILTDGRTWRLYHRELSSGSFKRCYQFNLGKLAKHVLAGMDKDANDYRIFVENAKYFYHFFSKAALHDEEGGRRFVDDLVADSRKYSETIEEDLKTRFVSAMAIACNGFRRALGKSYTDKQLDLIRSVAESHIFNILFIRFCESRNILPVRQNPEYRKTSLSNIIDKLDLFDPEKESDDLNTATLRRRFKDHFSFDPNGTQLYDTLLSLVNILQNGFPHEAAKFSITGFNETVFSEEELAFTKKTKLNNREMSCLLFQLAYIESDKPGRYQQIAYSFFAPRQLGSIYESFLEYRLDRAECDMAFIKQQWKAADLSSEKIAKLKVPVVKSGHLFFSPNNDERKATGSYYTPDYVVQFILERALEPVASGNKSHDILSIRVCDPAMGSGHFLAGALNYLARKHLENLDREAAGDIDLTITDAKRLVLHHCIFGVDINPRAVKLSKMSLWLESAAANRSLEPLDDQILCGDSITDAFDWPRNFPGVFRGGGFDAVVGNPPYRKERDSKELMVEIKKSSYGHQYYEGKMDLWYFFLHRSLEIAKPNHRIGFIVPTYWLKSAGSSKLIARLEAEATFCVAVDFKKNRIFADVSGQHMIFVVERGRCDSAIEYQCFQENGLSEKSLVASLYKADDIAPKIHVSQATIYTPDGFIDFEANKYQDLMDALDKVSIKLEGEEGFFNVAQGIVECPDRVTAEMARKASQPSLEGAGVFVLTQRELNALGLNVAEKAVVKKYLKGGDVSRFFADSPKHFVLYIDGHLNKEMQANRTKYPNLIAHLERFEKVITSSNKPFGLHRAREARFFSGEKLLCHNMFDRPSFAFVDNEVYVNFGFNVVVKGNTSQYSLKYVLGIMNSKLGQFWFDRRGKKRGVNNDVGVGVLRELPIFSIDFSDRAQSRKHGEVVELVDRLTALTRESEANDPKVSALQSELDDLVLDLYSLEGQMRDRILGEGSEVVDSSEAA